MTPESKFLPEPDDLYRKAFLRATQGTMIEIPTNTARAAKSLRQALYRFRDGLMKKEEDLYVLFRAVTVSIEKGCNAPGLEWQHFIVLRPRKNNPLGTSAALVARALEEGSNDRN